MKKIVFAIAALALLASCQKEGVEETVSPKITLTVSQETAPGSKTQLIESGTDVYWTPGDKIKIYSTDPYFSNTFTSTNTEPATVAEFECAYQNPLPDTFVAVYPSSGYFGYTVGDNTAYTVYTSIPPYQTAVAGTFEQGAYPMACMSDSPSFTMYGIAGGIRFTVQNEGINKVVFKGNKAETLSGSVNARLAVDNHVPSNIKSSSGNRQVTLQAPEGQTLTPGEFYYIVMAPNSLESGFTMVFYKEDGSVATVRSDNPVTIKRTVFGSIRNVDNGLTFSVPEPEMVDLGLSVKWASMNVGALNQEDMGTQLPWGEVTEKSSYYPGNYIFIKQQYYDDALTKYCTQADYGYDGLKDDLTELQLADDVANTAYGDQWRIPSPYEWEELKENCTWVLTDQNDITGYLITSTVPGFTDNSIFLPVAFKTAPTFTIKYHTSLLDAANPLCSIVMLLYNYGDGDTYRGPGELTRGYIASVRPVYGAKKEVSSVSLNESEIVLEVGESFNLSASVSPSSGQEYIDWRSISTSEFGIVRMTPNGGSCLIEADSPGTAFVTASAGNKYSICKVKVKYPQPQAVDLGLSVKWADRNIGAANGTSNGVRYAWGETEPKLRYTPLNYRFNNVDYGYDRLRLNDDAARAELGDGWRLPTVAEVDELKMNCSWTFVNDEYDRYATITGQNGWSINLPLNSYPEDYCWTANQYGAPYSSAFGLRDYYTSSSYSYMLYSSTLDGYYGLFIRPVYDPLCVDLYDNTKPAVKLVNEFCRISYWPGEDPQIFVYCEAEDEDQVSRITLECREKGSSTWNLEYTSTTRYMSLMTLKQSNRCYEFRVTAFPKSLDRSPAVLLFEDVYTNCLPTPQNVGLTFGDNAISCSWDAVEGAEGYTWWLYDFNSQLVGYSNNCPSNAFSVQLGGESAQAGTITWADGAQLEEGLIYWFKVCANGKDFVLAENSAVEYGHSQAGFSPNKCVPVSEDKAVDLGLSVKWAPFNIGATVPEQEGCFFSWGETDLSGYYAFPVIMNHKSIKNYYNWAYYKWCKGTGSSLTKYNTSSTYGTVDNRRTLLAADDAANVNWGGSWRMPTKDEMSALVNQCNWQWTTVNGMAGWKVSGKKEGFTDNYIFLPAAGTLIDNGITAHGTSGSYWTSTLYKSGSTTYPTYAWSLSFNSTSETQTFGGPRRCYGESVRAVLP